MQTNSTFTVTRADMPKVVPGLSRITAIYAFVILSTPGINAGLYAVQEWHGSDCVDLTPAPDWLIRNTHLLN